MGSTNVAMYRQQVGAYNIPKAGFVVRRVTVILGSLSTSKSETVMFSRLLGPAWLRWA